MGVDLILWSFPQEGMEKVLTENETYFSASRDFVSTYFDGMFTYDEAKEFADAHSLDVADYGFLYSPDFNSLPEEELMELDELDLMKSHAVPAHLAYPAFQKLLEILHFYPPGLADELKRFLQFLEKNAQHDYLVQSSWT